LAHVDKHVQSLAQVYMMFSTKEQLEKRTGPYGVGRFSYLQSLVTEYQDTTSQGAV